MAPHPKWGGDRKRFWAVRVNMNRAKKVRRIFFEMSDCQIRLLRQIAYSRYPATANMTMKLKILPESRVTVSEAAECFGTVIGLKLELFVKTDPVPVAWEAVVVVLVCFSNKIWPDLSAVG